MRRIICGKAYDTDTATLVATNRWEDDEETEHEDELYRTQGGAFFVVISRRFGRSDEWHFEFQAMTAEVAEDWFNRATDLELHDDSVFTQPEEATAEDEKDRTIAMSLRVPSPLRDRLAKAASKERVSMNTYLTRCAQRCLDSGEPMKTDAA